MIPLIINFVPTGMVPMRKDNPNVPITPNEIIDQVHEAFEIGITIVHLHARDETEQPTYKASIFEKIFQGIKKYCPELVICASLSGRNFSSFEKRSEVLELRPDMASLTLGSLNFLKEESVNSPEIIERLAKKMDTLGVTPELEVFDIGMINYAKHLTKEEIIRGPFYFNIILGNVSGLQNDASSIGLAISCLPENSVWSLGGIGRSQFDSNMTAIALGGGIRVGLEDNIFFDRKKRKLATNLSLVMRMHELAGIAERPIMTSRAFGEMGFYNTL